MHRIGIDRLENVAHYDYIFIGSFMWDYIETPDEVNDFVIYIGYKPENVEIFGTAVSKFGTEVNFCGVVDKLAKFYHTRWDELKIEQYHRGSQEQIVKNWLEGVLEDVRS